MFRQDVSEPVALISSSVVACLLSADDLIILLTTADGLQKSFVKLHKYCPKWKVEGNQSKSKELYINKNDEKKKPKYLELSP